jgi:colanic acid biosynthesis glycosyl transferase WcaI
LRVTILHRYFWPLEYPYAQMLKDIAETLTSEGHKVVILTTSDGTPGEKALRESWAVEHDIAIRGLRLGTEKKYGLMRKAVSAFYFSVWGFCTLIFHKQEIVMVATTPPVIGAVMVRWASIVRGFNYIYHCQDIHPEGLLLTNHLKEGWLYRLLLKLDINNIEEAWRVITLSEDMKNTFRDRGCRVDHVHVINNFPFRDAGCKTSLAGNDGIVRFLFAGNLGRFQNLEVLINALVTFRENKKVKFIFMGSGIMYEQMMSVIQKNNLNNVELVGQRSLDSAIIAMQEADFGIVSCAPEVYRVAYPSKAIMYFCNGLPVLALIDEVSELSALIRSNQIGVTANPTSQDEIERGIQYAIDICHDNPISKSHVSAVSKLHFGKEAVLNKFANVFGTCE